MAFSLPPLPYPKDALEPHMSSQTLDLHYGKHHNGYVVNLNTLVEKNKNYQRLDLEEVVIKSRSENNAAIFNNAAQAWNHRLFWQCMRPQGGGSPRGEVAQAIERDFGSYSAFKEAFKTAGITQFGSGWAWLTADKNGTLEVTKTPSGENPVGSGKTALIGCDVWEHSYYLDFHNRRPDYMETFLTHLVNWDFVNDRLSQAVASPR